MGIRHGEAPGDFGRVLRQSLMGVVSSEGGRAFLGWEFESAPPATRPHPVYAVGRDDVLEGRLLDAARLTTWRSLIRMEDGAVHAVELSHPETDDEEPSFVAVTKGPFGKATMEATDFAGGLEAVGDEEFELRLLKIPSLYFVGVWLRGEEEGHDAIVPLADHPSGLEARQAYAPADIVEALLPQAKRALELEQDESN